MKGRVLVVDDDHEMCELLKSQLGRRGFEVQTCSAANQALAQLATEELDAVVTDVRMRGLDGIQLCEHVP
jgi:two-component system response regulator HydG